MEFIAWASLLHELFTYIPTAFLTFPLVVLDIFHSAEPRPRYGSASPPLTVQRRFGTPWFGSPAAASRWLGAHSLLLVGSPLRSKCDPSRMEIRLYHSLIQSSCGFQPIQEWEPCVSVDPCVSVVGPCVLPLPLFSRLNVSHPCSSCFPENMPSSPTSGPFPRSYHPHHTVQISTPSHPSREAFLNQPI